MPLRKLLGCFVFVGAFAGCIPYPRLARVYFTPQYTGLFLDRNQRPVPNVFVCFREYPRQGVRTGADGRAVLRARRSFQVIGFLMMEPAAPRIQVRASWSPTAATGAASLSEHVHWVKTRYDQRSLTTAQDTVILPLL